MWLMHCCAQFEPFGIRTLCFSFFHIIEALLTWKLYGNIVNKDLIPRRFELGTTMHYPNLSNKAISKLMLFYLQILHFLLVQFPPPPSQVLSGNSVLVLHPFSQPSTPYFSWFPPFSLGFMPQCHLQLTGVRFTDSL